MYETSDSQPVFLDSGFRRNDEKSKLAGALFANLALLCVFAVQFSFF